MKILFLIRSLNRGGAERQLIELCIGLSSQGHQIKVLLFYSGGPLERELRNASIPIVYLNKRGRWDILGFFYRLTKQVAKEKPDILHGYLDTANILCSILKFIFPEFKIVWGVRASNMELVHYDWLSRIQFKIECKLAQWTDLIISNSFAGRNYVVKNGYPPKKIRVIHNGIDIEKYHPDKESGKLLRKEWGVNEQQYLIGLVGRLDPMKDHPTFLKAAQLLYLQRDDVRFVCIGDGPESYKKTLFNMCKDLGLEKSVVWAGALDDMCQVYNALDIATSSSSFGEGFSNVIAEAMSCGIPCVATDVGDSAIIVGDTGEIVPPLSEEKICEGWKHILHDDLGYNSSKIRSRIENNFNCANLTAKTLVALEEII